MAPIHSSVALEWRPGQGHRLAELTVPKTGKPGFTQMRANETGILFAHQLKEERGLTNQILMSGSGLAAGDIDGDGWCDLYFCNLDGPNALSARSADVPSASSS